MPAPARKAEWKPSVSTLGSRDVPVTEIEMADRTARPSAPPTCCVVLINPLARPASLSGTPETAAIVVVTNANPRPTAARSDGPRMSPRKLPCAEICENQTSAAAIRAMPIAITCLNPIRVTSCDAMPADRMIETASGRYESPALIALYPSTCCMYSEMKKNIENSEPPTSSPTTFAPPSVRIRNTRKGTSGLLERRSIPTNAAIRAEAAIRRATVRAEPQPALFASSSA